MAGWEKIKGKEIEKDANEKVKTGRNFKKRKKTRRKKRYRVIRKKKNKRNNMKKREEYKKDNNWRKYLMKV